MLPSRVPRGLLALLLVCAPPRLGAQGVTSAAAGTMIGDVVMLGTETPLDHAMISLIGGGRQTFSNDRGVFAFSQLAPGTYHLRVVHLGFTPAQTRRVFERARGRRPSYDERQHHVREDDNVAERDDR